ncbi:MAG: DUF4255 domain-containing protein [Cyanobacteria bacterium J007]|jgi:hypothetical protein|nr:MAG: DUF4255 domain-containing protein [Cyanobacteria bacterium J007]
MIPAVAQTLAEILAGGTSLIDIESIDLNHPSIDRPGGPRLNLYCYNLWQSQHEPSAEFSRSDTSDVRGASPKENRDSTIWFDVSFLVTAWDNTALGEQRLLSEALTRLLSYRFVPEDLLEPSLRGHGELQMRICVGGAIDTASLWRALGVPLRPALYVTIAVPAIVEPQSSPGRSLSLTPSP